MNLHASNVAVTGTVSIFVLILTGFIISAIILSVPVFYAQKRFGKVKSLVTAGAFAVIGVSMFAMAFGNQVKLDTVKVYNQQTLNAAIAEHYGAEVIDFGNTNQTVYVPNGYVYFAASDLSIKDSEGKEWHNCAIEQFVDGQTKVICANDELPKA